MTLADIGFVSSAGFVPPCLVGHWTELVYLINGAVVAVFFIILFSAIAFAGIKWLSARLMDRKAQKASAETPGERTNASSEDSE